jgi:hypothetical protein
MKCWTKPLAGKKGRGDDTYTPDDCVQVRQSRDMDNRKANASRVFGVHAVPPGYGSATAHKDV